MSLKKLFKRRESPKYKKLRLQKPSASLLVEAGEDTTSPCADTPTAYIELKEAKLGEADDMMLDQTLIANGYRQLRIIKNVT